MLTDSERFAFVPSRLHGFATTGNAYDACQCDEAISKGDTLVILAEGVIGIAWVWPIAITAAHGVLHRVKDGPETTLADLAQTFGMTEADLVTAIDLARALSLSIDPVFDRACSTR